MLYGIIWAEKSHVSLWNFLKVCNVIYHKIISENIRPVDAREVKIYLIKLEATLKTVFTFKSCLVWVFCMFPEYFVRNMNTHQLQPCKNNKTKSCLGLWHSYIYLKLYNDDYCFIYPCPSCKHIFNPYINTVLSCFSCQVFVVLHKKWSRRLKKQTIFALCIPSRNKLFHSSNIRPS